jgi:hypothetical protein
VQTAAAPSNVAKSFERSEEMNRQDAKNAKKRRSYLEKEIGRASLTIVFLGLLGVLGVLAVHSFRTL